LSMLTRIMSVPKHCFSALILLLSLSWLINCNEVTEPLQDGSASRSAPQQGRPPNVVILFADDLGYGDLECFGHPTSSSANINNLAQNSKVFTNFYVGSAICTPSRAALLTGLYPASTGMWPGVLWPDSKGGLDPAKYKTIASHVKEHGYATQIVGKWHLGVGENGKYLPLNHGFDHYLGVPYSQDMCPCPTCFPASNNSSGECNVSCNPHYVSCPTYQDSTIIAQPTDLPSLTDSYTKRAKDFISSSSSESKPFFLYMAYQHTHFPQFAGAKFHGKSDRGAFGDSLEEMDNSIGEIMEALKSSGQLNNTLVIFTADNGPSMGRHINGGSAGILRCGKGTTYEGGQRVPAMFSFPGKIKPGKSHDMASTLDILPTILKMVDNTSDLPQTHGLDLSPHLFHDQASPRDHFAYYTPGWAKSKKSSLYAIRYKQHKAHFVTQGSGLSDNDNYDHECRKSSAKMHDPPLMYDLSVDPGERYPLDPKSQAYKSAHQNILKIKSKLETEVKWAPSEVNKGSSRDVTPCCNQAGPHCEPYPMCCNCKPDFETFPTVVRV